MRILVLGGLGMLGHRVYQTLSKQFSQVYVCIKKPTQQVLKYGFYKPTFVIDNVDLLHPRSVELNLKNINPDIIINCAGITKAKGTSLTSIEMIELNALIPQRISEWCQQHSVQFIQMSNDEVFKGRTQPYTEESTPDSVEIYGRAKALGELLQPRDLIFRSHFVGPELEKPSEIFSTLLQKKNERVVVNRKKIYTGVTTLFMSQLLAEWIHKGIPHQGLFNIASQPMNEYELVNIINQHFELNLKIELNDTINWSEKPKILSNKKLLNHWGLPTPQWSNMISDIAHDIHKNDYKVAV